MAKKSTKAPSASDTDNNVGASSRPKQKQENKPMNPIFKALFGVTFLVLKVSFIIAGVALIKMPVAHFIVDIPIYQVVGGIILAFLVYLELYGYFVKPLGKKEATKRPKSPLDGFKLYYEEHAK